MDEEAKLRTMEAMEAAIAVTTVNSTSSSSAKSKFMINDILNESDQNDGGIEDKFEDSERPSPSSATAPTSIFPAMTALALANIHNQQHPHQFYPPGFLQTFHLPASKKALLEEDIAASVPDTKVIDTENCDSSLQGDQASSGKLKTNQLLITRC